MNDDLQKREYENIALQVQRDVYKEQLQKCQNTITHLKDVLWVYEFYEYPFYIARIQRRFITTKKRWFEAQYLHHRFIMNELDNPNGIHVFNRFEEKGFVECFQCHFRLADIPRDTFYALAIFEE